MKGKNISYWQFLKRVLYSSNEVMGVRKQIRRASVKFFVLGKVLRRQRLDVWVGEAGAK